MNCASLINVACANNQEAFQRLRDFLCKRNGTYDYSASGIGWTLHDSFYAIDQHTLSNNDWVVLSSPGENGRQALYVQLKYSSSGGIALQGWLYWNAATHAGVLAIGTAAGNTINTPSGAAVIWVLGDLDCWYVGVNNGSAYNLAMFACIKPGDGMYDNTIAIAPGAIGTGSNVVVPVDLVPAAWQAGQKIYLWDTAGISIVTIASVGAADVTLVSVPTARLAGSRLSGDLGVYASTANNLGGYMLTNRTSAAPVIATVLKASSSNFGGIASDGLNGLVPAERVGVTASSCAYGYLPNILLCNSAVPHNTAKTGRDGTLYRCLKSSLDSFFVREA